MSDHTEDDDDVHRPRMPRNEYFLSPEQPESAGTPPRVLSSHSLAGEDIVLSARAQSDLQMDNLLSPFTPSEETNTPPSVNLTTPLTPPPISQRTTHSTNPDTNLSAQSSTGRVQHYSSGMHVSSSSSSNNYNNVSRGSIMRPPRGPHGSILQPLTKGGTGGRHGRVNSSSDCSFLSALTEGTLEAMTIPKRRTLSWDNSDPTSADRAAAPNHITSPGGWTHKSTQSTPASILQPILVDFRSSGKESESAAPPASIITANRTFRPPSISSQEISVKAGTFRSTRNLAPKTPPSSLPSCSKERLSANLQSFSSATKGPISSGSDSMILESNQRGNMNSNQKTTHGNTNLTALWNPMTSTETGSFVLTTNLSERSRPSSPFDKASRPKPKRKQVIADTMKKRYTVDEVLDAFPAESEDETLLMKQIESRDISRKLVNQTSPYSDIPAEILQSNSHETTAAISKETKTSSGTETKTSHQKFKTSDTFSDIAKRLMGTSPTNAESATPCNSPKKNHRRTNAEGPKHAGDKMYHAAETLFGAYTSSHPRRGDEEMGDSNNVASPEQKRPGFWRMGKRGGHYQSKFQDDLKFFSDFMSPHQKTIKQEFFRLLKWIMFPSLAVASILFYVTDNPPTGYETPGFNFTVPVNGTVGAKDSQNDMPGSLGKSSPASVSWWIIFVGVRQVITLELARFSQLVVIDFLTFRTRRFPKILGPSLSLLLAQSKGWPFILFTWAIWDMAMLYGDRRFAHHWAYWQSWIDMMNETNPHGDVTSNEMYHRILYCALGVAVAVALKRALIGQMIGRRVVRNYRNEMGRLMQKLQILVEVSYLGVQLRRTKHADKSARMNQMEFSFDVSRLASSLQIDSFDYSDAQSFQSPETHNFNSSMHMEMMELLEQWEEPELQGSDEETITMSTILQFRRALLYISNEYPFSMQFGSVRSREDCVTSAQNVFENLTAGRSGQELDFEILCLLAKGPNGELDRHKIKELIRVFRPDRNGHLSKLDFVKSVDSVYKTLRLLLASINNSQQIDRAYETIVNTIFFLVLSFLVFAVLGINVQALVIGASSVLVSSAFIIGSASSKYMEGILFVLVRRPFDIGDRVNIDEVRSQPNTFGGESSWIIEKVDLYSTTARLGSSRELATFSNGSLAGMRIVNLNRSEKPNVYLPVKFPIDSSMGQRQLFRRKITTFIKERPRQWIKLVAFRSTRVEVDLGFVEFILVIQHREKWQNLSAVLVSRGEVFTYAIELQKELGIRYKAPHVPVDIRRFDMEEPSQIESFRMTQTHDSDTCEDELKKQK